MTESVAVVAEPAASVSTLVFFGALGLVGILVAGLLAGLEIAFYSLSQVRLAVRAARGDAGAARLAKEQASPHRLLSALLITHAFASWLASFGTSQIFDSLGFPPVQAVLLDLVVLVPVVFIFAEVLPKDLFRIHGDRWLPRYAGFLRWLRLVLTWSGLVPIVASLGMLAARLIGARSDRRATEARARMSALLAEGAGTEGLSELQLGFADRVFTMRGITVGQEMRPWRTVSTIPAHATPAERAQRLLSSGVSRLPVVSAAGAVVGVVAAVDHFARPSDPTHAMARPALLLAPSVSALEAISRMRRERVQLAIVGDRIDRPLGIVSMKDLVEPLVGDLAAW